MSCGSQERSGAQADNALLVKHSLHLLEDAVESVELPTGSKGVTRAGEFVYALFGHAGITFDNVQVRASEINKKVLPSVGQSKSWEICRI